MRTRDVFRRIEAAAGKFNRWFGPAAVAANTIQDARVVNATDVSALMRELDKPPAEKPPSS